MTGDEIIALARQHFGEPTASSISTTQAKNFLNAAVQEMYGDLPVDRLRDLVEVSSLTFTDGQDDIPSTWDRVLAVYVGGVAAVAVSPETIQTSDTGAFFTALVPLYSLDTSHMWVRPVGGTVTVAHIDAPAEITNFTTEVTSFGVNWHPALASLVACYMYAQEEDAEQAQYYRNEYLAQVTSVSQQMEAESA